MKDTITVQSAAPVKVAKEKTLKIILKKIFVKKTDSKNLVKRILD